MYINGGESSTTSDTKKTDSKTTKPPPTTSTSTGVIPKTVQTGHPINPQTLVTPSADDGNISTDFDARVSWVYKLTKPQLQAELNRYGVPNDGNSQQLRAELVRLARGGIAKSPSLGFAPTEYGSVSRATSGETLPNNENVQSKTGTEMDVIREMLGLPPTATFEEVKRIMSGAVRPQSQLVATRAATFEQTTPRELGQNSEYELMASRNVHPSNSLPRRYYEFTNTRSGNMASGFESNPHSISDTATLCNMVRKWNLRFDGRRDTDAISFLERLHELMDAYE
ncbi:hypothetical protein J6590_106836, partial [Homalodisca vitripennis]